MLIILIYKIKERMNDLYLQFKSVIIIDITD